MVKRSCLLVALLVAFGSVRLAAGADVEWPALETQLQADAVVPGSALERFIAAHQDFSGLRAGEAEDRLGIPLWLRVAWRKAHPETVGSAADPTGGYPPVLRQVYAWMRTHQDLLPGAPESDEGPDRLAAVTGEMRISGAPGAPRSASDVRVNPRDPLKILAASDNVTGGGAQAQFHSADGGASWSQTTLPLQPGDAFHSDPAVDWTSDGTAWATTIGVDAGGTLFRMRAYKSVNGGATWTFDATFSGAQTNVDKPALWVDHSDTSPFKDNVYALWVNGAPAFINRRTGPAGSWQTPLQVSGAETAGTAIGGDVTTNAFGDVFGFWPATVGRKIFAVKSTNGGTSFGTPVQVATTFDSYDIGVPAFNQRRALLRISAAAWRTAGKNLAYAAWTDLTGAAGCNAPAHEPGGDAASACKTRIWFARSADGGATWSPAVMVNHQASLNDQFNPALLVDEATGALALVYYDTVGDPGRTQTHLWYQASFNDGLTWLPAVQVTSAATDETTAGADAGNQYGDANGLSGISGVFFPTWTDRRGGGFEEIWTAKITDPACTPPGAPAIGTASAIAANQIQLTWGNGAPAASAFHVERAVGTCAAPGAFTRIAGPVAGSPFLDTTVSGGTTYAYRVVGVDASGRCESPVSGCAQATATGTCTRPPAFAGLTSATSAATATCGVSLAWSAATAVCAGPVSYNVYRSTTPGFVAGPASLVAAGLSGTSYADTSPLANGTTYFYVVRAVDGSNGAAETNTVERSAAPAGPVATGTFTETFEGALSGGGFDNAGWTHGPLAGAADWVASTAQSQTPTHSWLSASQAAASDRVLVTPPFGVLAGTALSFWHTYAFETNLAGTQCYDGGTLEISTDGGTAWSVVPDAAFTSGLFNGTVNASFGNPIGGRRAWCQGTVGAMTQVNVNLGSFAGAAGARLRWHAGDDQATAAAGWYVDSVTLTNAGLASACSPAVPPTPRDFYTLTPCRIVDTRNPAGPLAGPALVAGATRTFVLTGTCGVPATAKALMLNLTAIQPAAAGYLTLFPANLAEPVAASITFAAGAILSNNATVGLATDASGGIKVKNGSAGTLHLAIDVTGYYE